MYELTLPCKVGDKVMAYLEDAPANKRKLYHLSECTILSIEFKKDWPEPLFTAVCYEKAMYNTFWLSDFGKEIFSIDQYIQLCLIDSGACKSKRETEKIELVKRKKYAGDVHRALVELGWDLDTAASFLNSIPDAK